MGAQQRCAFVADRKRRVWLRGLWVTWWDYGKWRDAPEWSPQRGVWLRRRSGGLGRLRWGPGSAGEGQGYVHRVEPLDLADLVAGLARRLRGCSSPGRGRGTWHRGRRRFQVMMSRERTMAFWAWRAALAGDPGVLLARERGGARPRPRPGRAPQAGSRVSSRPSGGCRTGWSGGSRAQATRWSGVRNRPMSRPISAMMTGPAPRRSRGPHPAGPPRRAPPRPGRRWRRGR